MPKFPNQSRKSLRAALGFVIAIIVVMTVAGPTAAVGEPPHMVKDIMPGDNLGSYPTELTAVGDVLYFSALDKKHGREPWTSDGTALGTVILKNIAPGSAGSRPAEFTQIGNLVFFSASDGSTGRELWVTDGTRNG